MIADSSLLLAQKYKCEMAFLCSQKYRWEMAFLCAQKYKCEMAFLCSQGYAWEMAFLCALVHVYTQHECPELSSVRTGLSPPHKWAGLFPPHECKWSNQTPSMSEYSCSPVSRCIPLAIDVSRDSAGNTDCLCFLLSPICWYLKRGCAEGY